LHVCQKAKTHSRTFTNADRPWFLCNMKALALPSHISVLISYQAYPGRDIHQMGRQAVAIPVLQGGPGAAHHQRQEPRAGDVVGAQPPKPPQLKPLDDGESNAISSY
jgi:hypothetical protein